MPNSLYGFSKLITRNNDMFSPSRVAVLMILVLILSFASWSKLRFVDDDDHMSQRWRLQEHPQFQDEKASNGNTLDQRLINQG